MNKKFKIFWAVLLLALVVILTFSIKGKEGVSTSIARPYDKTGEIIITEPPVPMASSYGTDSLEYKSFTEINEIRVDNGLRVLSYSAGLSKDAEIRAKECNQLFSHTRPNGTDWYTVDPDIMYGENLAQNYNNANDLVTAWMNSPTHRELILTADYNTCGIGVYIAENGSVFVALEFGY